MNKLRTKAVDDQNSLSETMTNSKSRTCCLVLVDQGVSSTFTTVVGCRENRLYVYTGRRIALHDGRHKARYVAGGHMTDPLSKSVYSGVVSLRILRLVTFLSEFNSLKLYSADVGNAY